MRWTVVIIYRRPFDKFVHSHPVQVNITVQTIATSHSVVGICRTIISVYGLGGAVPSDTYTCGHLITFSLSGRFRRSDEVKERQVYNEPRPYTEHTSALTGPVSVIGSSASLWYRVFVHTGRSRYRTESRITPTCRLQWTAGLRRR